MMSADQIINEYIEWIRSNSEVFLDTEKHKLIATPFLDTSNDHIEIMASKTDGRILLSDSGETLSNLKMKGFDLNTPKRLEGFNSILNGTGTKFNSKTGELFVLASESEVGQKKHSLIQTILSVADLFLLSQANVASMFREDIERFFVNKQIMYIKDVKFVGKSGMSQNFDFSIPKFGARKNDSIVKSINNPSRGVITNALFSLNDVAATRGFEKVIIYNDRDHDYEEFQEAFSNYEILSLPWSNKEKIVKEFSVSKNV